MRTQKSWTAFALSLAILAASLGVNAQDRRERREPGQRERIEQNEILITREGPEAGVRVPAPDEIGVAPLRGDTFVYLSTEMSFDGKTIKGAPYSAEAVTESVQALADGNRIVRRQTSQIYRDGEGRTRREFTLNMLGPWASAEDPPRTVSINDPVAGVSYSLDPRSRTARKITLGPLRVGGMQFGPGGDVFGIRGELEAKAISASKTTLPGRVLKRQDAVAPSGARGQAAVKIKVAASGAVETAEVVLGEGQALRQAALDAARQWRFKPGEAAETAAISFNFDGRTSVPGDVVQIFELKKESKDGAAKSSVTVLSYDDRADVKGESLGKQFIEGVEAEGTRTVRTIPAGEIGNEQPIEIVNERWYSPELQVVVMTRHKDPRLGETTYRLTNIVRAEPAATLFQVPSDYTVKEAQPFVRGLPPRRKVAAPPEL